MRDFAKYFDYIISSPDSETKKNNQTNLNGVTIITADSSVNVSELTNIFTSKNLDAEQLRNEAWQRKK